MFTNCTFFVNSGYIFSGYTILNKILRISLQKEKGIVMVRARHMECGVILKAGMILTAWLFWAAVCSQIGHAVFRFPVFSTDSRSTAIMTSTDYRFQERFLRTLKRYGQFQSMYQEEYSTAIPGLAYTSLNGTGSRQMVPQGICIAGDYMLITAYDSSGKENSVVYVLSNEDATNRSFLTTLILPDKNHVGGITFDGRNLWIAKSTTGYVSGLPYDLLKEAVATGDDNYTVASYSENLYCGVTASFISYGEDRLWIGTYRFGGTGCGMLYSYRLGTSQEGMYLERESATQIPPYAQGVTFLEEQNDAYMLLSTSCGRYNDSKVYLYQMYEAQDGPGFLELARYNFPPMAEELVSDGVNTYFLFESAATCYGAARYYRCTYPVDRISALSNQQLLAGQ